MVYRHKFNGCDAKFLKYSMITGEVSALNVPLSSGIIFGCSAVKPLHEVHK
jgi:hypothetical protein